MAADHQAAKPSPRSRGRGVFDHTALGRLRVRRRCSSRPRPGQPPACVPDIGRPVAIPTGLSKQEPRGGNGFPGRSGLWRSTRDSNPQPPPSQGGALSSWASRTVLVAKAGIEPAYFGYRPNALPLSYIAKASGIYRPAGRGGSRLSVSWTTRWFPTLPLISMTSARGAGRMGIEAVSHGP